MMIVRKKDVTTFVPGIHLHAEVLHMGTGVYELLSLPKTIRNFILAKTSLFPSPYTNFSSQSCCGWLYQVCHISAYSVLILSDSGESIMCMYGLYCTQTVSSRPLQ